MEDVTAPNGKIYALGGYNYCYGCTWTWNFYIDVKLLDRFHLKMPRTTAQFSHVLGVFKEHGIVPLTGSPQASNSNPITFLMDAFIPSQEGGDKYIDIKNGRLVFSPAQPQWRKGLKYIHSLYAKGYFSKTAFTQQQTAVQKLMAEQKVGVVPDGYIETIIPNYGTAASHYQDWLEVPALAGPNGFRSASLNLPEGGGFQFAITNKATKQQEIRILKLLNFTWTLRGIQIANFGPEGKFWVPAKKGQLSPYGTQAAFNTNFNAFYSGNSLQNEGWNQWGPYFENLGWRKLYYGGPPYTVNGSEDHDHLLNEIAEAGLQPKQVFPPALWIKGSEAETFAADQTNIQNYVSQWTTEFATGEKSISADWGTYLNGLKKLGLAGYLKIVKQSMGKPVNTPTASVDGFRLFEPHQGNIKFLLCVGPIPPLIKKYMIEGGVPSSDFACKGGVHAQTTKEVNR